MEVDCVLMSRMPRPARAVPQHDRRAVARNDGEQDRAGDTDDRENDSEPEQRPEEVGAPIAAREEGELTCSDGGKTCIRDDRDDAE